MCKLKPYRYIEDFPAGSDSKESACNAGDLGLIPQSGRSPGEGKGYALEYSCLEDPIDRGAWWATVCGVIKRHDQETNIFHYKYIDAY